jgi:osmotically-inducible protein OsmY
MTHQYCNALLRLSTVTVAVALTPALAAATPSDIGVTYWVQTALHDDSHIDATGIRVTAKEGVVTLEGNAPNLTTSRYAVQDAEMVDGVIGVIDRIDLVSSRRPDFDIAQDVRHRITNNSLVGTSGLTITASEGVVTLTGDVDSWAERQEASIVAGEVRGVREVKNDLNVRQPRGQSDDSIREDAKAKLDLDVYLNGLPISVDVEHGVATLSGSVGSQFEKDRAERELRYLACVRDVKNNLKVERWENRGARVAPGADASDSALRKHVATMLKRDTRVHPSKIDVQASGGHVTLTGSVPCLVEKRIAEQDAKNTVGTAWVTNKLLVNAVHREDDAIMDDVLSNLTTDYLLNGLDISIHVRNGTVSLTGEVGTKWEREHTEEVVSRVPGVKMIENHIRIDPGNLANSDVAEHIMDRLSRNWITASICKDITVTADGNVITLTGNVDTWAERAEAAQVALRTPGVWSVHNSLSVHGVPYVWKDGREVTVVCVPDYSIMP